MQIISGSNLIQDLYQTVDMHVLLTQKTKPEDQQKLQFRLKKECRVLWMSVVTLLMISWGWRWVESFSDGPTLEDEETEIKGVLVVGDVRWGWHIRLERWVWTEFDTFEKVWITAWNGCSDIFKLSEKEELEKGLSVGFGNNGLFAVSRCLFSIQMFVLAKKKKYPNVCYKINSLDRYMIFVFLVKKKLATKY